MRPTNLLPLVAEDPLESSSGTATAGSDIRAFQLGGEYNVPPYFQEADVQVGTQTSNLPALLRPPPIAKANQAS